MTSARRRSSAPRRARGRSTPTMWWNEQSANNTLAPGLTNRFGLATPNNVALPATFQAGLTVVRMIIDVIIKGATINAFNFGAFGVMVNTAGATLDAIIDLYDWYLHQNWAQTNTLTNDSAQWYRRSYDIRTARRVRGEQRSLDFAITNNAASPGSIVWTVNSRMLLKGS